MNEFDDFLPGCFIKGRGENSTPFTQTKYCLLIGTRIERISAFCTFDTGVRMRLCPHGTATITAFGKAGPQEKVLRLFVIAACHEPVALYVFLGSLSKFFCDIGRDPDNDLFFLSGSLPGVFLSRNSS